MLAQTRQVSAKMASNNENHGCRIKSRSKLVANRLQLTSLRSPFVKIRPTLPTSESTNPGHSSLPVRSQNRRIERFIIVFLPISTTLSPCSRRPWAQALIRHGEKPKTGCQYQL